MRIYPVAVSSGYSDIDIETCWSACTGLDQFGEEDNEIDKLRRKFGENLSTPGCGHPILVLYRATKTSDVHIKLSYTRTVEPEDDIHELWSNHSKVWPEMWMFCDSVVYGCHLLDWGDSSPRYEFQTDLIGRASNIMSLRGAAKLFWKNMT